MPMPIDYSKWDNLDVSSSSSSSEEDEEDYHPKKIMQQPAAATPRVTRLEAPSTVTFGGGASPVLRPPPPGPVATVSAAVAASAGGTSTTAAAAAGIRGNSSSNSSSNRNRNSSQRRHENKNETNEHDAPPTPKQQQPPPSWTERGGTASIGGAPLYWSQDRYSVTLRWELPGTTATTNHNKNDTTAPPTTVVATVDIGGILPYRDRCAAVGTTLPTIAVRSKSGEVLLEERLPHPVHGAEEDGNRPEADWSVEPFAWSSGSAGSKQSKSNSKPNSNSSRNNHHHHTNTTTTTKKYLTIVLHKAVPMQGLSLWWRRPLLGVPEIDLADAKGDAVGASSKDFLGAWERAHELFREGKRTAKKPL